MILMIFENNIGFIVLIAAWITCYFREVCDWSFFICVVVITDSV